jgi:nucleoside-diphosphate-sugar epimerase
MGGAASVILGASGFIGTRLVRRLHARGGTIRALDILPPRERLDGVDYQVADVRDAIYPVLGTRKRPDPLARRDPGPIRLIA